MKKPMQISLRAGERIYINGAVVRVDRRVTIELLNDVSFLFEAAGLRSAAALVDAGRIFDALRAIRALFTIEEQIMSPAAAGTPKAA